MDRKDVDFSMHSRPLWEVRKSPVKINRNFQQYFLWLLLIVISASCNSNEPELDCPENENTHTLVLADSTAFPLDTNSNPNAMHYCYNETDQQAYFGFYNHLEHAVYIYDYQDQHLIKIVPLFTEGPNEVSTRIGGVNMIDSNTIVIMEKVTGYLKIIDSKSQVLKKIRIFQDDDFIRRAAPNSNLSRPLILHENNLYLTGLALGVEPIPDHTQFNNAYQVDLANDEVQAFLPRPSIYNQGQYGLLALYQLFCNENLDRSGILYSFGLSPDIYAVTYGHLDKIKSYCLKSDDIDKIKPYEADRDNWHYDNEKMMKYDENISYYGQIYALPASRHYVRFSSRGPNFVGGNFRKNFVSIFDEKFNKLGETSIREDIRYGYTIFSNERGLHLMKDKQDEDYVKFYIYEVVPKI